MKKYIFFYHGRKVWWNKLNGWNVRKPKVLIIESLYLIDQKSIWILKFDVWKTGETLHRNNLKYFSNKRQTERWRWTDKSLSKLISLPDLDICDLMPEGDFYFFFLLRCFTEKSCNGLKCWFMTLRNSNCVFNPYINNINIKPSPRNSERNYVKIQWGPLLYFSPVRTMKRHVVHCFVRVGLQQKVGHACSQGKKWKIYATERNNDWTWFPTYFWIIQGFTYTVWVGRYGDTWENIWHFRLTTPVFKKSKSLCIVCFCFCLGLCYVLASSPCLGLID